MTAPTNSRRRIAATAGAFFTITAMAACSSSASDGATEDVTTGNPDGPVSVTIAETPGMPAHFSQFGEMKGFFEDEGIDLEVTTMPGGAQQATTVLAGETQFTGGDVVSWNTFRSRGLPLVIVRPGTAATEDPVEDFSTVLVPADSPIQGPEDLEGATIAVNELDNVGTVTVLGALEEHGVDPDSVSFVEIQFPDMLSNLANGAFDAAWVIEPFSTIGQMQGNRPVLYPFAEYHPGTQVGLVLTSQEYAQQNPEVVEAFQRAHQRTGEYITEHPDEFREALLELGEFDPQVVEQLKLPVYNAKLDRASIERAAESMVDYGLLDSVPETGGFIHDNA